MGKDVPCRFPEPGELYPQPRLFFNFPLQLLRGPAAFQQGEAPQSLEHLFHPLIDQHPVFRGDNGYVIGNDSGRPGLGKIRQHGRIAFRPGPAEGGYGAGAAVRRAGDADGGPQIHHGLIMVAGPVRGHEGFGQLLYAPAGAGFHRIVRQQKEPADDPDDISVHRGHRNPVGNGSDGAGGIGADAFDFSEKSRIGGQNAPIIPHDLPCALVQIPGPGIISQPLPQLQHVLLRRLRQSPKGGEPVQKTAVIVQHGLYPGLLQHSFADPGPVGIMNASPGQHPGTPVIPGQQGFRDGIHRAWLLSEKTPESFPRKGEREGCGKTRK